MGGLALGRLGYAVGRRKAKTDDGVKLLLYVEPVVQRGRQATNGARLLYVVRRWRQDPSVAGVRQETDPVILLLELVSQRGSQNSSVAEGDG
jgi:hypothetical protein